MLGKFYTVFTPGQHLFFTFFVFLLFSSKIGVENVMKLPDREQIKVWIKTQTEGREWLADQCGVAKTTVDQWLSKKEIPVAQHHKIAQLMGQSDETEESETSLIRVPFPDDLLEKAHKAASIVSTEFQAYCSLAIRHHAENLLKQKEVEKTVPLSVVEDEPVEVPVLKKAHIMAAAGLGIMAEVVDWDENSPTINVKICGDSMEPLFSDGDVIEMHNRKFSRTPFMKKGLIYLVNLDGELMVKRYETRKPRKDEKDAEYLNDFGMVPFLASENPAFDEIIIDGNFHWIGWYGK